MQKLEFRIKESSEVVDQAREAYLQSIITKEKLILLHIKIDEIRLIFDMIVDVTLYCVRYAKEVMFVASCSICFVMNLITISNSTHGCAPLFRFVSIGVKPQKRCRLNLPLIHRLVLDAQLDR